jgi:tRNA 2-thiouridine synthesizing protein A
VAQVVAPVQPYKRMNMPLSTLPAHDKAIDITAETCPMTYVRTRLALDTIETGQILLVRLKGEDPLRNVPRAAADQGHDPLELLEQEDGTHLLVIQKG